MASKDMSNWIQFFKSAGIPPGAATSYATLFTNNRIQMSMLLDLTKEYLKDMGILVLGDIIAILKYAKTAHSEYEREKPAMSSLGLKADEKIEVKRQRTPGSRMLEHYMRKEGVMDPETMQQKVKVSPSMAVRLGAVPSPVSVKSQNKKAVSTPKFAEVVPVKKVRKVDPSEEGHYVISMPKGTTPKTQKILQKKQPLTSKPAVSAAGTKSSVFDRLGGGGGTTAGTTMETGDSNSVFKRLGGKQRERSLSNESEGSILEYKGVLKQDKPAHATEKTLTVKIPAVFQDRLGVQKPEVSTTSAVMDKEFINKQQKIQVRLGLQPPTGLQRTIGSNSTVSLNSKGGGIQKTISTRGRGRGGKSLSKTASPNLFTSSVNRVSTQSQPVSSKEPKVTITMGGANPKSKVYSRLGVNAAPNPANRSALGGGGSQVGSKIISTKKRTAPTMVSDIPQKKTTLKDRLGVQKAEASSTTPAFTVKLGGGKGQGALNQKGGPGAKRGGKGGNVFSRLGST